MRSKKYYGRVILFFLFTFLLILIVSLGLREEEVSYSPISSTDLDENGYLKGDLSLDWCGDIHDFLVFGRNYVATKRGGGVYMNKEGWVLGDYLQENDREGVGIEDFGTFREYYSKNREVYRCETRGALPPKLGSSPLVLTPLPRPDHFLTSVESTSVVTSVTPSATVVVTTPVVSPTVTSTIIPTTPVVTTPSPSTVVPTTPAVTTIPVGTTTPVVSTPAATTPPVGTTPVATTPEVTQPVGECAKKQEIFGMNVDVINSNAISHMKELGVKWVRIEYRRDTGGAVGTVPFYRNLASNYRDNGIKVLFIITEESIGALPSLRGTDAEWAEYRTTFKQKTGEIARNLADVADAWQVWNESDLRWLTGDRFSSDAFTASYSPSIYAREFGKFLVDGARAIREHSDAMLVIGGLASGNHNYIGEIEKSARNYGSNLDDYVGVGLHPYGQNIGGVPRSNWGFGRMENLIQNYLNVIGNKTIWLTEVGIKLTAQDVQYQDEYIRELYKYLKNGKYNRVPVAFWFAHTDRMGLPGEEFGIVGDDGTKKIGYLEYKQMASTVCN